MPVLVSQLSNAAEGHPYGACVCQSWLLTDLNAWIWVKHCEITPWVKQTDSSKLMLLQYVLTGLH